MKKNIAEIIDVSNEIYDKGLVSGKSGNISARFGNVVAITPTLKSLSNLCEEDIVLVDMDGCIWKFIKKDLTLMPLCTPIPPMQQDLPFQTKSSKG